jgi:small subunit ribosomal protein S1
MSNTYATQNQDTVMEEVFDTGPDAIDIVPGKVIPGRVVAISKGRVLVDLGGTTTGVVSGKELIDAFNTAKGLEIGDEVVVFVLEDENEEGMVVLSFRKASQMRAWDKFLEMKESKEVMEVVAREANKGGLMVDAIGVKAFLPVSQLAPAHYPRVDGANAQAILAHLESFIGTKFKVCVITINEESRKLVVSEREALQAERVKELKELKLGSTVKGRIHGLVKFGAFATFGNLEGLVHISEISWGHIKTPGEVLKVGQEIEALVIGVDGEKISLSVKRLTQDPWIEEVKKFAIGSRVEGTVTKVAEFGSFVALSPSVTGLVHKSQMDAGDKEKFAEGEKAMVTIMDVNEKDHSIRLTFKEVKPAAEKAKPEAKPEGKEETEKKAPAKKVAKKTVTKEEAPEAEAKEETSAEAAA